MPNFPTWTSSRDPNTSAPIATVRRQFAGVESTGFQVMLWGDPVADTFASVYSGAGGNAGAFFFASPTGAPLPYVPVVPASGAFPVTQQGSWFVRTQIDCLSVPVSAHATVVGCVGAIQQGSWFTRTQVDCVSVPFSAHARVTQADTGSPFTVNVMSGPPAPTSVFAVQQGSWFTGAQVNCVTTPFSVYARVTQADTAQPFTVIVMSTPAGGTAPTSVFAVQQGSWQTRTQIDCVLAPFSVFAAATQAGSWQTTARIDTVTTPFSVYATVVGSVFAVQQGSRQVLAHVNCVSQPFSVYAAATQAGSWFTRSQIDSVLAPFSVFAAATQAGSWFTRTQIDSVLTPFSVHATVVGCVRAVQQGSWFIGGTVLDDISALLAGPLVVQTELAGTTARVGVNTVTTPFSVYATVVGCVGAIQQGSWFVRTQVDCVSVPFSVQATVVGTVTLAPPTKMSSIYTMIDCYFNAASRAVVSAPIDTTDWQKFVLAIAWTTSGTDPAATVRVIPEFSFQSSTFPTVTASWFEMTQAPWGDMYQSPAAIGSGTTEVVIGEVVGDTMRLRIQGESCAAAVVVTAVARLQLRR